MQEAYRQGYFTQHKVAISIQGNIVKLYNEKEFTGSGK